MRQYKYQTICGSKHIFQTDTLKDSKHSRVIIIPRPAETTTTINILSNCAKVAVNLICEDVKIWFRIEIKKPRTRLIVINTA